MALEQVDMEWEGERASKRQKTFQKLMPWPLPTFLEPEEPTHFSAAHKQPRQLCPGEHICSCSSSPKGTSWGKGTEIFPSRTVTIRANLFLFCMFAFFFYCVKTEWKLVMHRAKLSDQPKSSSQRCNETKTSTEFVKNKAAEARRAQPWLVRGGPMLQGTPSRGTPDPGAARLAGLSLPPSATPPSQKEAALTHQCFLAEGKYFIPSSQFAAMLRSAAWPQERTKEASRLPPGIAGWRYNCPARGWVAFKK